MMIKVKRWRGGYDVGNEVTAGGSRPVEVELTWKKLGLLF